MIDPNTLRANLERASLIIATLKELEIPTEQHIKLTNTLVDLLTIVPQMPNSNGPLTIAR